MTGFLAVLAALAVLVPVVAALAVMAVGTATLAALALGGLVATFRGLDGCCGCGIAALGGAAVVLLALRSVPEGSGVPRPPDLNFDLLHRHFGRRSGFGQGLFHGRRDRGLGRLCRFSWRLG